MRLLAVYITILILTQFSFCRTNPGPPLKNYLLGKYNPQDYPAHFSLIPQKYAAGKYAFFPVIPVQQLPFNYIMAVSGYTQTNQFIPNHQETIVTLIINDIRVRGAVIGWILL